MTTEFVVDLSKLPPAVLDSLYHIRELCDFKNDKVLILYDSILHKYLDSICEDTIL